MKKKCLQPKPQHYEKEAKDLGLQDTASYIPGGHAHLGCVKLACKDPSHFCKLDMATSRMAFLDLNLKSVWK